jgi:hypothetical protein
MDLHVDRLTLRLAGLSASDGRRLAHLVAGCLASADAPGAATSTARLRVSVAPRPGESLESMAQRIAAELVYALRVLARSS